MSKLTLTLLAGSALAVGVPAAAQSTYDPYPTANGTYSTYPGQPGTQNRLAQLDARLQAGIQSGAISSSEARPIRQQIRYLAQLEQRYSVDGLSQQERRDLQQRYRYTRQQLRAADPDNSRYARWDRDNYDPYAANGYNNGYATNGYGANNGYGAGSNYQQVNQVCGTRSGLAGLLGSVFGSDSCLRVGERVTSASRLSAVPSPYNTEFRSDGNYTFRYYDGNVIQIENRTAMVTNIYDVRYGG